MSFEILLFFKHQQAGVSCVGTPPPDDTWRASLSGATPFGLSKVGHVTHIAIRSNSARTPQKRDTWRAPLSGLPQGEAHVTRECHVRTITYPIQIIY